MTGSIRARGDKRQSQDETRERHEQVSAFHHMLLSWAEPVLYPQYGEVMLSVGLGRVDRYSLAALDGRAGGSARIAVVQLAVACSTDGTSSQSSSSP